MSENTNTSSLGTMFWATGALSPFTMIFGIWALMSQFPYILLPTVFIAHYFIALLIEAKIPKKYLKILGAVGYLLCVIAILFINFRSTIKGHHIDELIESMSKSPQ